jgi:hypothetical protein
MEKSTMMDRAGFYEERYGRQAAISLRAFSDDFVPLLEDISHDLLVP